MSTNSAAPGSLVVPSLTSLFTPPPTCFQPTFTLSPNGLATVTTYPVSVDQNVLIWPGVIPQCYPPNFWLATLSAIYTYFSPGYCPSGWFGVATNVVSSVTSVQCCPTDCPTTDSDATSSFCLGQIDSAVFINNTGTTTSLKPPRSSTGVFYVYKSMISVMYQASDLSLYTTSGVSASTSGSVRPGASLTSSASNTNPASATGTSQSTTHDAKGSSLSTGAQAGIGVGVGIAGILLLLLGAWLFRRKRRQSRPVQDESNEKPELSGESSKRAELSVDGMNCNNANEIDGSNRPSNIHEVSGVDKPSELDDRNVRHELEGDWRGHEAPAC